jgi:hypothetical protein
MNRCTSSRTRFGTLATLAAAALIAAAAAAGTAAAASVDFSGKRITIMRENTTLAPESAKWLSAYVKDRYDVTIAARTSD